MVNYYKKWTQILQHVGQMKFDDEGRLIVKEGV